MGRTMTLRGNFPVAFGNASNFGAVDGRKIFEYASVNSRRGWKVRRAYAWIQEPVGLGGGDGRALWSCSLMTDKIQGGFVSGITSAATANDFLRAIGPSDNRSIGWLTQDMIIRDNVNADWVAPHGATQGRATEMITDADRIITNELYIVSYGLSEADGITYEGSFYIELEEIKLSPARSLFQQLKGMGQDTEPVFRDWPPDQ